jgi:hypothetical protein
VANSMLAHDDKLSYGVCLASIHNVKLRLCLENWVDLQYPTHKLASQFAALSYDPLFDVFFAHYGYEGLEHHPVASIRFTLNSDGIFIRECFVYDHVMHECRHLITWGGGVKPEG